MVTGVVRTGMSATAIYLPGELKDGKTLMDLWLWHHYVVDGDGKRSSHYTLICQEGATCIGRGNKMSPNPAC